jgi:ABC-type amino acid transport substrate-binding protein
MPLTPTMLSPGVAVEYLGGSEPLLEGVRLVSQGRADAVYSIIAAELQYMALGIGVGEAVKTVYLPDARLEMYTAFSVGAASRHLAAYDAAFARAASTIRFSSFLEPYLGPGATI